MNISIIGAGYVGLSLASLLNDKNKIIIYDIDENKINMINNHCSPIKDSEIEKYFNENQKIFKGTMNFDEIINNKPEFIIICVSTNFDEELNSFDTSNVENVIKKICDYKIKTTIVIKSTVPIGFTEQIKRKYNIT